MKITLEPFQVDGIRRIHKFGGRAVVADDMGLGKTVETIGWLEANPHIKRVVVACPAMVKFHWESEFKKLLNIRSRILFGRVPDRQASLDQPKVVIVNYDIVQYWLDYLKNLNPQLVVIDECQNIRGPDRQFSGKKAPYSGRTVAIRKLCRGVPYVLALGGTAGLENHVAELFAVLNIIRPDIFPSLFEFWNRYCEPKKTPWGFTYKGANRLDELHKILKDNMMIRRRKIDVKKDLPKKSRIVIPMLDGELGEYVTAERKFLAWAKRNELDKKMEGELKAQAYQEVGFLLRTAGRLKVKSVMEWVDNFLAKTKDEKIILFAIHKAIIRQLREHFDGKSVTIDGSTVGIKRKHHVRRFNEDDQCRVMIGQLIAAGIGWSAKSCSNTGTLEFWWNPAKHNQADGRVHGIGRGHKGKPVFNYYFVAKGTIEERVCRILQRKQNQIDSVIDGGKSSGFDLVQQLIQEMVK